MNAVFRLTPSELNESFLEMLKRDFNGFTLEIFATKEDETAYLYSTQANTEALERSLAQYEQGNIVSKSANDVSL